MLRNRLLLSSVFISLAVIACSSFDEKEGASADVDGGGGGVTDPDGGGLDGATDGGVSTVGIALTFVDTKTAFLVQGEEVKLAFNLARKPGSKGPVMVSVKAGLPANVTAAPVTVPAGVTAGTLVLKSDASAKQGLVTIDVSAVEDVPSGATSTAKRGVFVRGKPGTLDMTFGENGIVASIWPAPHTGNLEDAAVVEDGSILATGYRANPNSVHALAKLTPAGAKDTTFEGGGIVSLGGSQVTTAVMVHDATFSLKGTIDVMSGFPFSVYLHRYDATGKPVTAFNGGSFQTNVPGTQQPTGMQVAPLKDGKVLLLASYGSPTGSFAVTRWTAAGALDGTYGNGGACLIDASGLGTGVGSTARMVVNGDGSTRVVLALAGGESGVKGCTPVGAIDSALTKKIGVGWVSDLARTADGGMVVLSQSSNGLLQWRRFSAAGALDTAVGTGGTVTTGLASYSGRGLVLQPDGRVLVGGNDPELTGPDFKIARYLPNGQPDTSFGSQGTLSIPVAGTNTAELRRLVAQPDGRVLALGTQFNTSNGAIARFWP